MSTTKRKLTLGILILQILSFLWSCQQKNEVPEIYSPIEINKMLADSSYTQFGVASRYHSSLHGLITASGEPYDSCSLTAASTVLPLGVWVTVINVKTGKHINVYINDRGPFVNNRVIDLSHCAADSIGITEQIGIEKVIIQPIIK